MKYHLNQNGQNVGTFALEGLRRLRQAGELTGSEYVWTEGMAGWQTLDSVLQATPPPTASIPSTVVASPPPLPAKRGLKPVVIALLAVAVLVTLGVSAVLGLVAYKTYHRATAQLGKGSAEEPVVQQSAMDAASQPVAPAASSKTRADVKTAGREFRVRQYIEGYQLRGERNPECDLLALQFLTNWVAFYYGGPMDTNLPSLQELSQRLVNDPACQDPLIIAIAAINLGDAREEAKGLERAVNGYENSKHLGYPKFYASVILARSLADDQPDRVSALDSQALKYFKAGLADGSIRPDDQSIMAEILVNDWGQQFFYRNIAPIIASVQERGEEYRWLALVLRGENEIAEAWRARGGGYQNTVSDEGWKGFFSHLTSAKESLAAAWQLRPDLPLAPCAMMKVSLGSGGIGPMRQWFDRTIAAQIDYAEAWSEMRWGLRPRWFGDYDSMLALGVTALNTRRFDTDVPRMFFDSLADLELEMQLPPGEHIYGREDIWPHIKELYEGYIAEPSMTPYDRDGWRSTYMIVASLAGKYDVARQQLDDLHWQPHMGNLDGWKRDLSLLPQEVAARTSPESSQVTDAENHRANGDLAGELQIYKAMSSLTNLDLWTGSFVREQLAALGLEKRLESADWVDFMPADTNLTGWHVAFGKFMVRPDGALEVQADHYGHLIYSRARVGADFEVRGQVEVMHSTTRAFQAGLVMGLPQWGNYNWYGFRMKRNPDEGDAVTFSRQWVNGQAAAQVPLNEGVNSFDFRYLNGRVTATVDGREVFKELEPPQNARVNTNEFLLGFGAANDANSTVLRYRHVQVRRLLTP